MGGATVRRLVSATYLSPHGGSLNTVAASENTLQANFYEKALFVKGDVATALWWKQLLFALRAMLLFALSGSSLGSSVHYEIRLFKLEALQSSERSSWKGRPSSLAQSPC